MNVTITIAKHLQVNHWQITRVEEWAKVLFAVVKGLGSRFVSKKVISQMSNTPTERQSKYLEDLIESKRNKLSISALNMATGSGASIESMHPESIREYLMLLNLPTNLTKETTSELIEALKDGSLVYFARKHPEWFESLVTKGMADKVNQFKDVCRQTYSSLPSEEKRRFRISGRDHREFSQLVEGALKLD
jgi:hypothetical protein